MLIELSEGAIGMVSARRASLTAADWHTPSAIAVGMLRDVRETQYPHSAKDAERKAREAETKASERRERKERQQAEARRKIAEAKQREDEATRRRQVQRVTHRIGSRLSRPLLLPSFHAYCHAP